MPGVVPYLTEPGIEGNAVNNRPIPRVSTPEVRPRPNGRAIEPALYAGIVARRIAIVALMLVLIAPSLWSAVTGQQMLLTSTGASGERAIAVVAPHAETPAVGERVAVRTETVQAVQVGRVADVGSDSIALRNTERSDSWTAPLSELHGAVLAVFDGPVANFLATLPPFSLSAVIIIAITALVAIPLRRNEPNDDAEMVALPTARHIKHFHDVTHA